MSNAKLVKSIRAAVDEIIAQNDTSILTALSTILQRQAQMEGSVTVSTTKRKARSEDAAKPTRGRGKAAADDDDEELDLSDDDDADDEDEEDDAPKSRRSSKKPAKPARGRKAAVEEDDEDDLEDDGAEDDDGDDDGEAGDMPELADLSDDSIYDFLGEIPDDIEIPDHVSALGLREVSARVKELGGDAAELAPAGSGARSERTSALQLYVAQVEALIDAVAAFGYADIKEAYDELFEDGEIDAIKGAAKAKAAKAAELYVVSLLTTEDDE